MKTNIPNSSVVLITGALTGIGRATALAFARKGARVVVSGRRDEAGQALATELRALVADAEYMRSDVRSEDDVRALVDKTLARFGRLDVAFNNASTERKPGPVTEQSADACATIFDPNVLGTLLSMKHELRVMQAQGSGSIVNLASTMGSTACLALYIDASGAALKARLIAGAPLKRAGTPEEIAQTIVFLAHEGASTPWPFHA